MTESDSIRDPNCPCCGAAPDEAAVVEIIRESDGYRLHGAACEHCGNVYIP